MATNVSSPTSFSEPMARRTDRASSRCLAVQADDGGPDGDAAPDLRRGVRHGADHGRVVEPGGQGPQRCAGHDRQDDLALLQRRPDLAHDGAQHLRLHGQHHDVGARHRLRVARHHGDPVPGGEQVAPVAARMRGDQPGRGHGLVRQQAGDHGLGHHAGADDRHPHVASCVPSRRHETSFSSPAQLTRRRDLLRRRAGPLQQLLRDLRQPPGGGDVGQVHAPRVPCPTPPAPARARRPGREPR